MDIDPTPLIPEEVPAGHRSGFIAIVGKPNVGKSTLVNHWLGTKVAAVSSKPQTTRTRLLGILTREDAQLVFIDTPGIHLPHNRLGEIMVQQARSAVPDADLVLLMVDLTTPPNQADQAVAALVADNVQLPALLVLNKADALAPDQLTERLDAYRALGQFDGEAVISALTGEGAAALLERIVSILPTGPRFFPADQLTDQPDRFFVAEVIREKALGHLEQEVPHAAAVLVNSFVEREDGVLAIEADILVERDSQKGIVIGKGGAMLKAIGSEARADLERFYGCRVYLGLWVKVRKDWRKNMHYLRDLGLAD
ncbi:MAG: GTPase Era [Chloroflexi bacterium]|jgi:GTP-binding protein Era|nr:GTPase Era [Chloroflexota bacterium]